MGGELRALIVEDDRSWQQILSEILTDVGLQVDVADSLDGAIASLRAMPHRLAIIDLALGSGDYDNQDGLRVLDAVRRLDPGCVPVMLTGFATVELAVSVLTEHGAFHCLRKEVFDRAEFRELVERALASAAHLKASDRALSHDPADETVAIAPPAAVEPAGGVVLVVEDDAGWRSILSELLADAGYQVRLCNSYGEALGCLRRESYVLVVVDLSLAGPAETTAFWGLNPSEQSLEGYQLLASTRACSVPSIVVSGVATPDDIARAYAEQGIFAYLEKQTFDRRAFLQTVTEAMATSPGTCMLEGLTRREREVLELLTQGMTNKDIAESLVITTNTVKRHLKAIFSKLDVHTRSAAAARAISAGFPARRSVDGADDVGGLFP